MKLIVLLIGLAVGFGGGVYWGNQHPMQAATLSDTEQKEFLQAQLKIAQAVKSKLDSMATKNTSSGGPAGSGFLSGGSAAPADLSQLQSDQDRQIQQIKDRLSKFGQ